MSRKNKAVPVKIYQYALETVKAFILLGFDLSSGNSTSRNSIETVVSKQ